MKVLISGAGVGGLTAAYWLKQRGIEPLVIEKHEDFPRGGFLIGMRGPSVKILEKMGLLERAIDHSVDSIHYTLLNSRGKRLKPGIYLSYKDDERGKLPLNRQDLHRLLYQAVEDKIEIRSGVTLTTFDHREDSVDVRLSDGTEARFDLIIAAEGTHSPTRKQVFGMTGMKDLGSTYAAFISPINDTHIESFLQFAQGRMSILYNLGRGEFAGIFVMTEDKLLSSTNEARREALINLHDRDGKLIQQALEQVSPETRIFSDRMFQVDLPVWHQKRVVFIGDAAYSLSPGSGFGATAAMAGAYVLAEELEKRGMGGLRSYERRMQADIVKRQRSATNASKIIASDNRIALKLKDLLFAIMPEGMTYKKVRVEEFGIS